MESARLALVLKAFMVVRAVDGNFNTAWIFFFCLETNMYKHFHSMLRILAPITQ